MSEVELTPVERINAEHRACEVAAHSAVEHAINAGELLTEVKAELGHGEFGTWLEANFEGTARSAQTYMKLARNRDALEANTQHRTHLNSIGLWLPASDLSIRGALAELPPPKSKDREPEESEDAAIRAELEACEGRITSGIHKMRAQRDSLIGCLTTAKTAGDFDKAREIAEHIDRLEMYVRPLTYSEALEAELS